MPWAVLSFSDGANDGKPWAVISGDFSSKSEAQTVASREQFSSISDKGLVFKQYTDSTDLQNQVNILNGGFVSDTPAQTQERGFSAPSNPAGSVWEPDATQIIEKARELEAQGLFLVVDNEGVPIKDVITILPEPVPEIQPQDDELPPEKEPMLENAALIIGGVVLIGTVLALMQGKQN